MPAWRSAKVICEAGAEMLALHQLRNEPFGVLEHRAGVGGEVHVVGEEPAWRNDLSQLDEAAFGAAHEIERIAYRFLGVLPGGQKRVRQRSPAQRQK